VSIINRDRRIVGVQNCFVTPAGTEVIDLSSKTVLPGFIDTHDHISMGIDWAVIGRFTHNETDSVVVAMRNAVRDIEQASSPCAIAGRIRSRRRADGAMCRELRVGFSHRRFCSASPDASSVLEWVLLGESAPWPLRASRDYA
jgi:hypothetical protein